MDNQKYRELVEVLLGEVENNSLEPINQIMVDRAEELTAMVNELKHCIRIAIAECESKRRGGIRWN